MQSRCIRHATVTIFLTILGTGCFGAGHHARAVQTANDEERLTLGNVQREIRNGMSGAEVAEALGSPNIVTTDEQGREVWVYDKIASDRVTSGEEGGGSIIILGASGGSSASSTSQRTLTVVIKFDEQKRVRDFAYHASRF